MAFPIAIPPAPFKDSAFTSGISLTLEEMRKLIRKGRQGQVLSLEEKRNLQKAQVKGIKVDPAAFIEIESKVSENVAIPGINIWIVDIDFRNENKDFEIDKIQLQAVPLELRVNPESNFVSISPMGRNNPFYHYSGGEDTLNLTLDWYSDKALNGKDLDNSRTEVLRKCKWLEAKQRRNGLEEDPHRVKLLWGGESTTEDGITFTFPPLFSDAIWIVESAPYDLSLFHKLQGFRPTQAIQKLTLKRVTESSRTSLEIMDLTT